MKGLSGAMVVAIAIGALVDAAGCGGTSSSNDAAGGGGSGGGGLGQRGRLRRRRLGRRGRLGRRRLGRGTGRDLSRDAARSVRHLGNGALMCFYEDCAGSGRTVASCVNGAWSVETGPCTGVVCQSQICQPGEVCVIPRRRRAAGRLRAERLRQRRGVVRLPAVVLRHLHGWRVAGVRRYHSVQHVSVRPVPVTGGES